MGQSVEGTGLSFGPLLVPIGWCGTSGLACRRREVIPHLEKDN